MDKHFNLVIWLLLAFVIAMALYSPAAQAEIRLLIGGWSTHLVSEDTTNSNHKVLGVDHRGWTAGYFQNSYGRPTWFAGKSWRFPGLFGVRHLEGIVGVGASYGYRECWGDQGSHARLCPDATLGIAWTKHRVVPALKLKGDAVVFQPEIKF